MQLVERALGLDAAGMGHAAEAQRGEIESLVDAVHGHARTLALLAPALRERGAAATQAELVELIEDMERCFPGQREHSLLASVELSLRRLPPALRERAAVLGVFHGAVDLRVLRAMTGWPAAEVQALGEALLASGLASAEAYNHLSLNPALCPYLAARLAPAARAALAEQWGDAMRQYAEFLVAPANGAGSPSRLVNTTRVSPQTSSRSARRRISSARSRSSAASALSSPASPLGPFPVASANGGASTLSRLSRTISVGCSRSARSTSASAASKESCAATL
ncbi:MAG: hypothetical protein JNL84_03090 [Candidatus Accumulibacter sp.]|nr:hypothetical protein [Accumulibacter sp.]